MMTKELFDSQFKIKERIWNVVLTILIVGSILVAAICTWNYSAHENQLIYTFFAAFTVSAIVFFILKAIDEHLRRSILKEYWVEDTGEIVKLHGSIRLINMKYAYRDLLRVRPGLKIADDAYELFGCTLAAVPATNAELEAKKTIESLGVPVNMIG